MLLTSINSDGNMQSHGTWNDWFKLFLPLAIPVRRIRVPREQRVLQIAPLAGPDRRHAAKRLAADAHLLVTRWYQWHVGPTLPLVLRGFAQPDTPGRAYASLATVIAKLLAALGAGLGLPRRWGGERIEGDRGSGGGWRVDALLQ